MIGALLKNEMSGIHGRRKQYDSSALDRKVERFIKATGKPMDEVADAVTVMVAESAGKITPPGSSYQIGERKFKRPMHEIRSKTGSLIGYRIPVRATDRKFTKEVLFRDCASRAEGCGSIT